MTRKEWRNVLCIVALMVGATLWLNHLRHRPHLAAQPHHYFSLYETWSYSDRNNFRDECASITHYPLADEHGQREIFFDEHWEAFRGDGMGYETKSFNTADEAKAYVEQHWCITKETSTYNYACSVGTDPDESNPCTTRSDKQ